MKSFALAALAVLALTGTAFAQDYVPPNVVTNFGVGTGNSTATAYWTSPGDQCTNATCAEYDLRYSTSTLTDCNFTSGTRVTTTNPKSPGQQECFDISSLSCNTTYYWAVKTKDSSGNWSALSTVLNRATVVCSNSIEVICE